MRNLLVLYGSYRPDRLGIRLADYLMRRLAERGNAAELVDAKALAIPMLEMRTKDWPDGEVPEPFATLSAKFAACDGFVLVAGEYNWGVQPGLKNLVDHFGAEFKWRPAAVTSYSTGRTGGSRSVQAWLPSLVTLGMAPVPATITCGEIDRTLDALAQPQGAGGAALERSFDAFAPALEWWVDAAKAQRVAHPTG